MTAAQKAARRIHRAALQAALYLARKKRRERAAAES